MESTPFSKGYQGRRERRTADTATTSRATDEHGRFMPSDEAKRFWSKVDRRWRHRGCWLWTGTTKKGYPVFKTADGRAVRAHRWAYEALYGPVPDGLDLDHVCHSRSRRCRGGPACRHRRCVRPDHLEPVTVAENLRRARDRRRRRTS